MYSLAEHSIIVTYQEVLVLGIVVASLLLDALVVGMLLERRKQGGHHDREPAK